MNGYLWSPTCDEETTFLTNVATIMYRHRPYRCQACRSEKEILSEDDGPVMDFCEFCSINPDAHPGFGHAISAFDSTRTLRPFECIESWIDEDMDLHEHVMKRSHLFSGMYPWQVKRVIMLGETKVFQPGETIVSQGQSDRFTYVLLAGSARVIVASEAGEEVQVNTIGVGEVFGEVASMLGIARTANVIADTKSRVFALDAKAIERIGSFYPRIAFFITRNCARVLGIRFRGVNAELAEWKALGDDVIES